MAKAKIAKWTGSTFVNELYEGILDKIEVTKKGTVKLPKAELRAVVTEVFEAAAICAAKGQRVRLPVVGALCRKDVKARQAGKGTNPFTGEPMVIKARAASKKPRWSFPKSLKETFAAKKNW